ncbi:MAG: flagellar hook assembly protein FlgD [Pirellulaceae bacterium]
MSAISAVNSQASSAKSSKSKGGINDVNVEDFLTLMIAEMQNQDPLNPMENSEMMQQLSQMRSIGATDKLTGTLDAVLLGQNLTTASSLIGKDISALTDDGSNIEGRVDRVTVAAEDGEMATVRIHIGENDVALQNIREILPADASE